VGVCWIALNMPGYGMHGTPRPEQIGKTGSHGCFRLANWDAARLGKMITPGIVVNFAS
jgi:lipoprotein-anchoring transpeptidase ErfK/SrfK